MHSITRLLRSGISILFALLLMLSPAGCRSKQQSEPTITANSNIEAVSIEEIALLQPEVVFEEPNLPQPSTVPVPAAEKIEKDTPAAPLLPQIAIIIDDMGHHELLGNKLLELQLNLTYSFLPHAPFTAQQELIAYEKGRDVMVHLPMEPKDPAWNPGIGALFIKDSPERLTQSTTALLERVPHAMGANNHMGSLFTESRPAMEQVLMVLQAKQFYFIDSYTTAESIGLDQARSMGIPTARRHVFLDNIHDQEKICQQIEQLVKMAKEKGSAIGIGHPNQATLLALTHCKDNLLRDVKLVGAHALVR